MAPPAPARPPNGRITLTRETLVPVGVALAFMTVVTASVLWINTQFQTMQHSLSNLSSEISIIKTQMDMVTKEQWTKEKMYLWIELMKASNKGKDITIPSIPK